MLRNAENKNPSDDVSLANGSETLANPSIYSLGDDVAAKQFKIGDTEGEAMTFVKLHAEADSYSDLFYRSVALSCIVNDLYGETGDYTTNFTYQSRAGALAAK